MRRLIVATLAASLMLVGVAPAMAAGHSNRAPAPGDATIAEIVVASTQADPAEFTLLLGALEYTGLTGVFTGGGQYTVFAPTDQAFLNLVAFLDENFEDFDASNPNPFEAIDDLLGENTVQNVLLYHVTEGRRAANSVVPPRNPRTITTLLGATFSVDSTGTITDTFGQEVGIVAPNISASNGIIHVVDTVLLPLG
jgi:uncharacterized surface protein with fasciclin (FAS1) repeats